MIPIRVTIENESDRPLRIRYNELVLTTESGLRHGALPPTKIGGTAPADHPVYVPRFAYSRFHIAPWYFPYYSGLAPWQYPYPWKFDRYYSGRYYPTWEVRLPPRDMRELAIPESIVAPGGRVSGFLYFPRILEKNLDFPMAPLLYTVSCMHCMPVSLGQGGDGLGTMWGWETAEAMLREAGFAAVERHVLSHDPMNVWFVCRPLTATG